MSGPDQASPGPAPAAPGRGRRRRKRGRKTPPDLVRESKYIANILTMARIGLIPVILAFVDNTSPRRSFVAMLLYLVASITDSLDGWLARRRKEVSLLGKFLDPLADKLMVMAVLVYLTAFGRVAAWVTVAMLARDLSVTGLRSIAVSEGLVLAASNEGKQKTALQMVATMFLLIHFRYPLWGLEGVTIKGEPLVVNFHAVGIVTLYLALAMSVISGAGYFAQFVRVAVARSREHAARLAAEAQATGAAPSPSESGAKPEPPPAGDGA